MAAPLARRIEDASIGFDAMQGTYGPMLATVEQLIGVVPKCDHYLEIWPPGFRTYNLVVPNLLNLPAHILGSGAPKDMVGLGMYVSSRAAGCAYCSAHTCSFALRRGAGADAVTGADRSEAERAVCDLAEAMGQVPHAVESAHVAALRRHFSEEHAEWIALGMVMMGFLNKFMDALGIELEVESLNDVSALIEPTGWSPGQHNWRDPAVDRDSQPPAVDSLMTKLRVIRQGPAAVRIEARWLKGVPKDQSEARRWLADLTGYDEPLIESFGARRVGRALAGVMRENLDPDRSEIGIDEKAATGVAFAHHLGNGHLIERTEAFAERRGVDIEAVRALGDSRWDTVLDLAEGFSPSPATVDDDLATRAAGELRPAEIVELAVWMSVLQMWHRWELYISRR